LKEQLERIGAGREQINKETNGVGVVRKPTKLGGSQEGLWRWWEL